MKLINALLTLLIAVSLWSCNTSTEPAPDQPSPVSHMLVASSTNEGYVVEVYADTTVSVGYTRLYVRPKHGGILLTDVHMIVEPYMDMGSNHHSCPVEQSEVEEPDTAGYYHCTAIFTMASANAWKLGITIHDHANDSTITVHVPIAVAPSSNVQTFVDDSNVKYIFTLNNISWKVGMNTIRFNVYRTSNSFDFTPVDDVQLLMTPTMPSMNHGSRGNVDPTSSGLGWYTGNVNFTMTGDWQIALAAQMVDGTTCTVKYPILVR